MKIKIYSIILLFCFVIACTSPVSQPTTTINTKQQSSESQYLCAIGYGKSIEAARYKAKVELARIFESKIESSLRLETHSVMDSIKGNYKTDAFDSIIKINSKMQLKGVTIENLPSKSEGLFAARAKLNKHKAFDIWLAEINSLDAMIDAEYQSMRSHESPVMQIKPIQTIWQCWLKRTAIESHLIVIGFSVPGLNDQIKTVLKVIADFKKNMTIHIQITGSHVNFLVDAISNQLTRDGFLVTKTDKNASVLINGQINIQPVTVDTPDWKFARAQAAIQIIDQLTGNQVNEINASIRQGHLTYQEASLKSLRTVCKSVQEQVEAFFNPFYGQGTESDFH